jgi:hypothetical protein
MQKTCTLLASLAIMAALALVATLCRTGGANNVSTNKGDWTHTDLTHVTTELTALLVRVFGAWKMLHGAQLWIAKFLFLV